MNATSENVPSSKAINSSLEQLLENPYRLELSVAPAVDYEPGLELSDSALPTKDQPKFDDISILRRPLRNLEELRIILVEVLLSELERLGYRQPFPNVEILDRYQMYNLLYDAARLGNSNLIQQLGKHFENAAFNSRETLFIHLLDLEGSVAEWGVGESPLYLAMEAGYYHTVEALLNAGADPDGPEGWDESPLNVALARGHYNLVLLLIKRGARPTFLGPYGYFRCLRPRAS